MSFGTLKGGWSTELEALEKLIRVFEELGGEQEDEIHDLVSVTRYFIREGDVMVREAPFATSKKEKLHIYLFNDLLIMAKPTTQHPGRKYKVTHFIVLKQCTFKDAAKPDADGHFVETLTQVSRHRVNPDGSLADPHDTHARIVTRIEKLELAFEKDFNRQEFMADIHQYLDEVEKEMIARKDSAQELDEKSGAAPPAKQRSWATKKRHGTLTKKSSHNGGDDNSSEATTESVGGFSLADLEAKYSLDFKTPHNDKDHQRVEFEICFGDGPMGFSLGSAPGVGVLIGRLAAHSFAEAGGVCIGDRISHIEQEIVPLDMAWQEVVEKLKKLPRPVTITFERSSMRQMEPEEQEHHQAEAAATVTETSSQTMVEPVKKQRSWANRRAQNAATTGGTGGGVSSLGDLEKVYQKADQAGNNKSRDEKAVCVFATLQCSNDAEKTAGSVLKEILVSESSYVADLRCLVGEYIIPLRRTVRRVKCRDMEGASSICEHNLIRQTCPRTCSEALPMLDADNMRAIFCNTETLMTVNAELLDALQGGMIKLGEKNPKPTIKDVASIFASAFQRILPFFKMYSVYCHQYHTAIERLLDCRSNNAELNSFLTEREQKSRFNSLSGLLIKPIQRICKYPLLFGTLLHELGKSTQTGISSYIGELKQTADAVEAIAMSVNKQVGESEKMEDLLQAYEELGGHKGAPGLVEAHRKFVRTEDVLYHSSAADKEGEYHEKMLYLFNDLLVVAKSISHGGGNTLIHKLSSSNSLYQKRTSSLLKHMSSTARNTLTSKKSSSAQVGAGMQIAKIEQWLDVTSLTPVAMEMKAHHGDEDKKYGINIKHISRKTEEAPKRATLSLKRHSTANATSTQSGKIITIVERFEVWFFEADKRDEFLADLQRQIDHQEELSSGQKKAQSMVGTPKTQRSWTRKTRHDSNLSGGAGHARTSSANNALSEIESKYHSGQL